MPLMNYTTAFEREIRRMMPEIPAAWPTSFGALVDLFRPPIGTPNRPRSGTRGAAEALIAARAKAGRPFTGKDDRTILASAERTIQRYRALEGTAPRGGAQTRRPRAARGEADPLAGPRDILRAALAERFLGTLRRRGVFMRIVGEVAIKGLYFEERDSLPEEFLSGALLSQPWTDADDGEHLAPLDALGHLNLPVTIQTPDGDYTASGMEDAAGGFDNSYWVMYDPAPDRMIEGTFTVRVDYPGGLTLRLGPEP